MMFPMCMMCNVSYLAQCYDDKQKLIKNLTQKDLMAHQALNC